MRSKVEVLQRYAAGERNFQELNLCRADFRGADLESANFERCDLRGTNFTRANLKGVSFRGARSGLPWPWAGVLALGSGVLTILMAAIVGLVVGLLASTAIASSTPPSFPYAQATLGATLGAIALLFASVAVTKSLTAACKTVALESLIVFLASVAIGLANVILASPEADSFSPLQRSAVAAIAFALSLLLTGVAFAKRRTRILRIAAGMGAGALFYAAIAGSLGAIVPSPGILAFNAAAGDIASVIAGTSILGSASIMVAVGMGVLAGVAAGADILAGLLIISLAVPSTLVGSLLALFAHQVSAVYSGLGSDLAGGTIALTLTTHVLALLLGFYLGLRPFRGDARDSWLRHFALTLASGVGTRFIQANLTDADFTSAVLKHANFRNALCDRTCFHGAYQVHLAFGCEEQMRGSKQTNQKSI